MYVMIVFHSCIYTYLIKCNSTMYFIQSVLVHTKYNEYLVLCVKAHYTGNSILIATWHCCLPYLIFILDLLSYKPIMFMVGYNNYDRASNGHIDSQREHKDYLSLLCSPKENYVEIEGDTTLCIRSGTGNSFKTVKQGRSHAWAWGGLKPPQIKIPPPPNEMKPISYFGFGLIFLLDLSPKK